MLLDTKSHLPCSNIVNYGLVSHFGHSSDYRCHGGSQEGQLVASQQWGQLWTWNHTALFIYSTSFLLQIWSPKPRLLWWHNQALFLRLHKATLEPLEVAGNHIKFWFLIMYVSVLYLIFVAYFSCYSALVPLGSQSYCPLFAMSVMLNYWPHRSC